MLNDCPATEKETGNLNLKHKKESQTNLTPLSHIPPSLINESAVLSLIDGPKSKSDLIV